MVRRIDRVLGNLASYPVGSRTIERVPIQSDAMARRILRLSTSVGDLGVRFEDDTRLRDGDILLADDARVIAVAVQSDDVLIVYPSTIVEAVELGHALGNRHVPLLRDGEVLVVPYSSALEALFLGMDLKYQRVHRVLPRPFAHARAPHTHGEPR